MSAGFTCGGALGGSPCSRAPVLCGIRALGGASLPLDGVTPLILGEKAGTFFRGGGGRLYFDGMPGDDDGWFTLLASLLGLSSPMFDLADRRGPRPSSCVSCCIFLVV
jgi:hypothetical protein